MTIGQVARRAGVGVETVRFYEKKGLIPEPPRRSSGYREYPPETCDRITFIRRAKTLGFTLEEIGELLELRVHPTRSCATVRKRAGAKIGAIEEKIADLRRMRTTLRRLIRDCDSNTPTDECPLLASLGPGRDRTAGR